MYDKVGLHKYIRHGVGQPQADQASTDQHRRGHEDGDSFRNADKRPKDQVSQHCGQLTQSVAEPKARSSEGQRQRSRSGSSLRVNFYPHEMQTEALVVAPHLLTVGNDSVVTTSREFQAEMLRPL